MTRSHPWIPLVSAAMFPLVLIGAAEARAGEWRWNLTPYAWATDVSVDVEVADHEVVEADIPVEDLIDDLQAIVQLRLEGRHGAHGVMFDLFHVSLEDEVHDLTLPDGGGQADLQSEIGMTIFDVAATYDPRGDGRGFSLYYGARILDQRATIDAVFTPPAASPAERRYETRDTIVDALVGMSFSQRISPRWSYRMQADLSTGGTDSTWSLGPSVTCELGKSGRYALTGGYRLMKIDFADEDDLDTRMELSGALVGLRIAF